MDSILATAIQLRLKVNARKDKVLINSKNYFIFMVNYKEKIAKT